VLDSIATAHGVPMATIAVAWLLHQPVVTSVILGIKRLEQLDENLAATGIRMSDAEMTALDSASALSPEYPGWMVHIHGVPRRELIRTGKLH
jgi:aryl-alcohol dehydrogenase-like predicted oxidoreductase